MGFELNGLNFSEGIKSTAGKKKGKKEKKNKPAASATPSTKITVRQLLEQTTFLVNHQPRVLIPTNINDAGKRALSARVKCSEWFRSAMPGVEHSRLRSQNAANTRYKRAGYGP
jgi:CubicO group peptidase (beta-lactamase class C family)